MQCECAKVGAAACLHTSAFLRQSLSRSREGPCWLTLLSYPPCTGQTGLLSAPEILNGCCLSKDACSLLLFFFFEADERRPDRCYLPELQIINLIAAGLILSVSVLLLNSCSDKISVYLLAEMCNPQVSFHEGLFSNHSEL